MLKVIYIYLITYFLAKSYQTYLLIRFIQLIIINYEHLTASNKRNKIT